MTLKGKNKLLRNIIVCLVAVVFVAGIAGIVYSTSNASVKIHYQQGSDKETWDTKDEFNKKWFTNLKSGQLNFVVDLKEYYEVVSKTKEIILEEPFQIIASVNELNNISVLNTDVTPIVDEYGNFDGRYNVEIALLEEEYDYSLNVALIIEDGNTWDIPESQKSFNIIRDTIKPEFEVSIPSNDVVHSEGQVVTISLKNEPYLETTKIGLRYELVDKNGELIEANEESVINKAELKVSCEEEGTYNIVAYAIDKAGNMKESEVKSFSININNSVPKIIINNQLPDNVSEKVFYNTKEIRIDLTDEGRINTKKSNYTLTYPNGDVVKNIKFKSNLKNAYEIIDVTQNGDYVLTVSAIDNAGNDTVLTNYEFTVDNIKPVITIVQNGKLNNGKYYLGHNDNKEVAVTFTDANIGDNKVIKVNDVVEDLTQWKEEVNAETQSITYKRNFNDEGNYKIEATIVDEAGNTNDVNEGILSLVVDKEFEAVEVTMNGKEIKPFYGIDDEKNLHIKIIDDNISENYKIVIEKDSKELEGIDFTTFSTDNTIQSSYDLKNIENIDGKYEIKVTATDKAGNVFNPQENVLATFNIDTERPKISISEEIGDVVNEIIEGKYYNRDLNLVIETKDKNSIENSIEVNKKKFNNNETTITFPEFGGEIEEDGLKVVTLRDTLNDEKFKEEVVDEIKVGSNGRYTLRINSTDEAGNKATKDITFTIDKMKPIITMETDEEINQKGPNVKVTVNEQNFDVNDKDIYDVKVSYTKEAQGEGSDIEDNDEAGKLPSFELKDINTTVDYYGETHFNLNGKYTVKVEVVDAAGNNASESIEFTKDSEKPEIEINGLDEGTEYDDKHYNRPVTLDIKTTDFNQGENTLLIKGYFEGKTIFKDENGKPIEYLEINSFNDNGVITDKGNEKVLPYKFKDNANYELEVVSRDLAGNETSSNKVEGETTKKIKFTVDTEAPKISILDFKEDYYKQGLLINQHGLPISIKVIEENYTRNNVIVSYTKQTPTKDEYNQVSDPSYIDFKATEKDYTKEILGAEFEEEAIYELTVAATDAAGNIGEPKTVRFITDKTPPGIKVFYDGEEKSDNDLNAQGVHEYQSKKVRVETYDVNQSINTITVTQDGEPYYVDGFKLEGRNATFEHNFTQEGDYVVTVHSKDLSGRTSDKTFKFTIDTTPPEITIDDFNELDGSFNNPGKSVTVNVKEHNYENATIDIYYTKKEKNKEEETINLVHDKIVKQGQADVVYDIYSDEFVDDADYVMTIEAEDKAGNKAVKYHTLLKMTTDKILPKVSITGVENLEHYNKDKIVTISSDDENHKSNDITVTKDGQNYLTDKLTNNRGKNSKDITFTQEGEYVITLVSEDMAGNIDTTSVTFTIDTTAPVITPVFKGENRVIKPGEYIDKIFTPEFKLDEAEDEFVYIKLNEGQEVTGAVPMSSTEMVYHYTGQARDRAGNTTPLDITFTVDVTNPEVKVTGIIDGYFSKDMKPEYEITDTNLDNENTIVTLNDKVFESGTKIKDQDYYNLKLLGADLASNTTARNIVFAIDKDKPVIKFLEQMSGKYFTEDFIPNFIIEDLTDYTIIAMTLDGVDYEIGDPITEEGKHVLYIEVKDKAENVESISVEFILDKTPPKFIVNGIKDKGIYVEPVTAEITLENPLDKITGITVNGELAQGDVKEENGQQVVKLNFTDINDYEVVLKAVDEAGNETEEVINFKIAKKNIFTTIYANKTVFYPLVIALAIIAVIVVITVVRKNKKEETQEEGSEE